MCSSPSLPFCIPLSSRLRRLFSFSSLYVYYERMSDEDSPAAGGSMTGHGGPPLSVPQLAVAWSTSEPVIRRLLNDGELRGVKIGRSWRVFPDDAEAYIASRRNGRQCDGH